MLIWFPEALQKMKPYTLMKRGADGSESDLFENPVTGRPWHGGRSQRDRYWVPTLINPAYIAAQAGHSLKMLLEIYTR